MSVEQLFLIKNKYEKLAGTMVENFKNTTIIDTQHDKQFITTTIEDSTDILNNSDNILFYNTKIKTHPYSVVYELNIIPFNLINMSFILPQIYHISFQQIGNLIIGWGLWNSFVLAKNIPASFDFIAPNRTNNFTSQYDAWGSVGFADDRDYINGYMEAIIGTKNIRCFMNIENTDNTSPSPLYIPQINYYI